ncbi:Filamentation induced protein by cAMP/death on curing [Colletotrichum scovillei]|uniref:Filamentation induced protein by cAMP/death on curing n=2 Tax=Colletotrichum scovillei TaxID=1209932 RepID=A0A9P7QU86_9PEZI|nr:Filamentation induced protein by cAMP/death on curing [Colletotrichum scovillei]KAG7043268.1 Filamentation induced protein by cAMP/death on curing [Colletotrichum scovillei]KAG7062715.1 Filamentation induced protein by cAMP/death on curing [Colletotrichum scovillei]
MASTPETPGSPQSPSTVRTPKRKSIIGYFGDMSLGEDEKGGSSLEPESPTKKSRAEAIRSLEVLRSSTSSSSVKKSLLRGAFRYSWPPTIRGNQTLKSSSSSSQPKNPNLTLRMSDLYRVYGDNWAMEPKVEDQPVDVSEHFTVVTSIMDEVKEILGKAKNGGDDIASFLLQQMAEAVYPSNVKSRKGLGLDITMKLCMMIFEGNAGVEYTERTEEYQARLEALVRKDVPPGEHQVLRSRREVVQHAAAFQHIINQFVREGKPMTEQLIKDTHAILVKGVSGEAAGILSSREFGGIYRAEDVFVGTTRFIRPNKISEAMSSMILNLQQHLIASEKSQSLDPFATAAQYCDRFVNIHPFRDGNGRMCRLILNAILIKYARIVVNVGEHGQERDEYIQTARESREVGGHGGALATMVLKEATKSYRKIRNTLRHRHRE